MPSNDRDKLKVGLAQPTATPAIQRGRGVTLSTTALESDAETQKGREAERQRGTNAETQESVSGKAPESEKAKEPERTSRGFAVRADLVKAMKRVALDDDKKLYEVLEEAIDQYLDRRKGDERSVGRQPDGAHKRNDD